MVITLVGLLDDGTPHGEGRSPLNPRTAISFPKGGDVTIRLTVKTPVGADVPLLPPNLLVLTVKKRPQDDKIFQKTAVVANGVAEFSITPVDMQQQDPGYFTYDIWHTDELGKQNPVMPLSPLYLEAAAHPVVPIITTFDLSFSVAGPPIAMLKDQALFFDVARTVGTLDPEDVSDQVTWQGPSPVIVAARYSPNHRFGTAVIESKAVGSAVLVGTVAGKTFQLPVTVAPTPYSMVIANNNVAPVGDLDLVSVAALIADNGGTLHFGFKPTPSLVGTHNADFSFFAPGLEHAAFHFDSVPFNPGDTAWSDFDISAITNFGEWTVVVNFDGLSDPDAPLFFRRFTLTP